MRRTWIRRAAIAALVLGVLSWLFMKTVRDSIAEPYVIEATALSGWTLVLEDREAASVALLSLQPPELAVGAIFRQIFQRTMLTLMSPGVPALPVVLQAEYAGALQSALAAEEILERAREAGLERARLEPVCLASREEPAGGRTRHLFFAVFEAPALRAFRSELAREHRERGGAGAFEPGALQFVLPIASSERDSSRWWPGNVDLATECRAPLVVEGLP